MLNTKTMSVLKRISKQAPETRPVLKNYKIDNGMLYMTDGHKMVWMASDIKEGLYTIEGENVTETAGTYPDVLRLIPDSHDIEIKIYDVKNLLEFMNSCVKVNGWKRSDKSNDNLVMFAGNSFKLTDVTPLKSIQMVYNLPGENGSTSIAYYNPFYLIDILEFISANIDDNTATIKYNGSNRPLLIESTNGTGALLMPVRK